MRSQHPSDLWLLAPLLLEDGEENRMLRDSWMEQVERDLRRAKPGSPTFGMTPDDRPQAPATSAGWSVTETIPARRA